MKRQIDVEVTPTPDELAECFCEMCAYEQAIFFNAIARLSGQWDKAFCFQLEAISSSGLTDAARRILYQLGDYAYHNQQIHATGNNPGA